MHYGGSSSTPKACSLELWGADDIIHAGRRAVWFSVIRAEASTGLSGWRDALELLAEILEVVRADAQFAHFLDDRQEIGQ